MTAGVLTADYQAVTKTNWVAGLKHRDLQRLRAAVKRVHMKYLPPELCTNREADRIIEAIGPEVGERLIKKLVDGRVK